MNNLTRLKLLLQKSAQKSSDVKAVYYKMGVGDYAEYDQFIGVNVPTLRKLAKDFLQLTREELQMLIESPINEERRLALFILIAWYKKAHVLVKNELYDFYLRNLQYVNNWNLVDSSAHLIIGAHLFKADKSILLTFAQSQSMWERRIAIVATWYFIRKNELEWTFKLAHMLLSDTHDLIHKAVGWMLREAGKRDQAKLVQFLDLYASTMPRTMLRYAIEKFSEKERKLYLHGFKIKKIFSRQ